MSPNSYLLMFAIGYLVCCILIESLNPFKPSSWHQPRYMRTFGFLTWFVLALTPLFLDMLGVEKIQNKILFGMLFVLFMSAFFWGIHLLSKRLRSPLVIQMQSKKPTVQEEISQHAETVSSSRIQRKIINSARSYNLPPVVIDASESELPVGARRRIKSKRVTGMRKPLTVE